MIDNIHQGTPLGVITTEEIISVLRDLRENLVNYLLLEGIYRSSVTNIYLQNPQVIIRN